MIDNDQRTSISGCLLRRMHATCDLRAIPQLHLIIDLFHSRRSTEMIADTASSRRKVFPHRLHTRKVMKLTKRTNGL
jgi:hypothetical protein